MSTAVVHDRRCRECGADNDPRSANCWLCHQALAPLKPGKSEDVIIPELVQPPAHRISEMIFGVLTAGAVGLTLLVILGAAQDESGLAVLLAICAAPAFLAVIIQSLVRHRRGKQFSWMSTFLTFVVSITAIIGVLAVLIVAAVIAFLVICFRALAGA